MSFPNTVLPIRAELLKGGDTWVEVTADIRADDGIVITGGFGPEQTSLTPCNVSFTLNNPDGKYSDDNPLSSYYHLLPTNTPFRVGVEESGTFLHLPLSMHQDPEIHTTWDSGHVTTADKAVLDVTGDLDLRIDIEPEHWSLGTAGQTLAAKYVTTSNQRSWLWTLLPTGRMRLYWSTDGTNMTTTVHADSTAAVPAGERISVRVTIDVNNGASGRTITFYTSDSITGTWTQLGSTVVQSGTTSIFSSSADLSVGAMRNPVGAYPVTGANLGIPPSYPFVGRIYRFQMYSGIAGTLVADMNAAAQAEGTTSWSDGLGTPNTWTLQYQAEISAVDWAAYAEIADMPQESDSTGSDVTSQVTANGILRRLTQGEAPIRSAIYRNLRQYIGNGVLGYWTCEGGTQSSAALSNSVPGQRPGTILGSVSFAADSNLPGSAGVATLNSDDAVIKGGVTGAQGTSYAFAIFYHKLPSTPGSTLDLLDLYMSGGTIGRVTFQTSATNYLATAYTNEGVSLGSVGAAYGTGGAPGQWLGFQMRATQNGSNVDLDLAWLAVDDQQFYGATTSSVAGATVGKVGGFRTKSAAGVARALFAHVMVGNIDFEYVGTDFAPSSIGWAGENAGSRWLRICEEEGVAARLIGRAADTEPVGAQPTGTLTDVLDECVVVDDGLQFEAREQAAIVMRTRRSLYPQTAIDLDYTAKHLSGTFRPRISDQGLRNEVTAKRADGSSATASKGTGVRSIADVGRYDSEPAVNAAEVDQLYDIASWLVFTGTWPDRRVPSLDVWLQRGVFAADATLTRSMRALGPGDRVRVQNVPAWMSGADQDMIVRGYRRTLGNFRDEISFSTIQYGPYGAVNDLTQTDNTSYRAAAYNTKLAAAVTSSATSMTAFTPTGKLWRRSSGAPAGTFPMPVAIAGEEISVGALADVTFSYVAAGTASAGNAGFAGSISGPAGVVAGDLLLLLVAARNTSGNIVTPSGWTSIGLPDVPTFLNMDIFAKIATGSSNSVSVTFGGLVSGDTTQAQMAAFRPSSTLYTSMNLRTELRRALVWQANSSAQNIAYPAIQVHAIDQPNSLVIYAGWKADDWTSVTSPATEIDEPSTTVGNDSGIVWSYAIQSSPAAIAAGSFTVTGGAAAVSQGLVLVMHSRHQLMSSITRNTGGLSSGKAQAAAAGMQVLRPFYAVLGDK